MVTHGHAGHVGTDSFNDVGNRLVLGKNAQTFGHGIRRCECRACKRERENGNEANPLHCLHRLSDQTHNGGQPGQGKREEQDNAGNGQPVAYARFWAEANQQTNQNHNHGRDNISEQVGDHMTHQHPGTGNGQRL